MERAFARPWESQITCSSGDAGPQWGRVGTDRGGSEGASRRMLKLVNSSLGRTRPECEGVMLGVEVT